MRKFYILKVFNNINIRNKLLVSFVLVVLVPVLLVGLILTNNMRQMVVDRATNEALVNVDRIYNRLNETLKLIMDASYMTHIDENLETLLSTNYKTTQEVVEAYKEYKEFNTYINFYSREIKDIKLYSYNKTILDNGQFIKITPALLDETWFKKVLSNNGKIYWQYLNTDGSMNRQLCLSTVVKSTNTRTLGILVISINNDYLKYIVKDEPYETIVLNDTGNIIVSNNTTLTGKNIADIGYADFMKLNNGSKDIQYKKQISKAIVKKFIPSASNNDFRIISIVPVNVLKQQTINTVKLSFFIIIISLLLAFILIYFFSYAISKRVKNLSKGMHKVALGDFNFSPAIEGEDEIGQLSRDLDTMVKSIKALVHEVYEVNLQKKQLALQQREINLKILANQINPHFLFNVLETIRMKAHCKGENEIADIVKLLGKIMRRNLEIRNEFVTLESEIDFVKSYLEIQKFRYGNRINYIINLKDELKNYTILPLIIQPIVENAIIHGLESKQAPGIVKVEFETRDDTLIISVEDNGVGMKEDRLQQVLESLEDTQDVPGKRIGLINVHQRIKLCYGEAYGLRINSRHSEGTFIEILLPAKG